MRGRSRTRSSAENMQAEGTPGMKTRLDVSEADVAKQRDQVGSC